MFGKKGRDVMHPGRRGKVQHLATASGEEGRKGPVHQAHAHVAARIHHGPVPQAKKTAAQKDGRDAPLMYG